MRLYEVDFYLYSVRIHLFEVRFCFDGDRMQLFGVIIHLYGSNIQDQY